MAVFTINVPDDLSTLDLEGARQLLTQLDSHITPLFAVRARVEAMALASERLAEVAEAFLDARDGTQPASGEVADWPAYRQPAGAHDAYPAGRVIRWTDGRLYRATRTGVAHTPVKSPTDWTDVTKDLTGTTPPKQPSADPWSPTASYKVDALVSYDGKVWRCKIAHDHTQQGQWKPGAAWTVWELVG